MISKLLGRTHARKREAVATLAIIVEEIKSSESMSKTVKLAGLDPSDLYEAIKIGSKWYIKATEKHLAAAKAVKPGGYGV
jgi:hypothetical protein